MDRLSTLRVFVAVAEERGFAPAARRTGHSPPAVTRAIAALERRIGAQLFTRSTRFVRLTEAGERFFGDCKRILGELDEAEASARGAHAAPRGQLAVTAPAMFGRLHVAPLLLDFLAQHSEVGARAFFVDRLVHLLDEGFDIAVRIAHLPDSGLTAVSVGSMRRVIVASPAYLARRGEPAGPADLSRHDAIGFALEGAAPAAWNFAAATPRPRMRFVTNASEVAVAAALRGDGLARALLYQVADAVADGRLRIVLAAYEPAPLPVHVVHVAGRKAPAKVRAFVDFAVERLRAQAVLRGEVRPVTAAERGPRNAGSSA
jgi:DNA-binding transcriptional LysR family regulator